MLRLLSIVLILAPTPAFATDTTETPPADFVPPDVAVGLADTIVADMLTPGGPVAADWQKQGIDLIARISAVPGGLDSNAVVTEPGGNPSVNLYGAGALPMPSDTKSLLDLPGRPMSGDTHWQSVTQLDDELWMRSRTRVTRRENALCGYGWETFTILAVSDAPLFGEPLMLALVHALVAERLGRTQICVIAFEQPDGTLIKRSFLPDGRPLPKMDEQAKPIRIRPLADAAAFLKP